MYSHRLGPKYLDLRFRLAFRLQTPIRLAAATFTLRLMLAESLFQLSVCDFKFFQRLQFQADRERPRPGAARVFTSEVSDLRHWVVGDAAGVHGVPRAEDADGRAGRDVGALGAEWLFDEGGVHFVVVHGRDGNWSLKRDF